MTAVTAKNPWVELWRDSDARGTAGTAHANIAFHNVGNHSPAGINWGYGGSGPAALAGDLLCAVGIPKKRLEQRPAVYQQLKDELVARLPQEIPPDKVVLAMYVVTWRNGAKGWGISESDPGQCRGKVAGRIYIERESVLAWVLDKFASFVTEEDGQ